MQELLRHASLHFNLGYLHAGNLAGKARRAAAVLALVFSSETNVRSLGEHHD